ncbi:MAG: hypothetical protein AAF721_39710 [Myxococcota bacterium]
MLTLGLCIGIGCFIEDPLDITVTDTQGEQCTPGEIGCECDAGACGATLTCLAEADVCIPTGCDPGSAFCTCDAGSCQGELLCNGLTCVPFEADESTGDDNGDEDTGGPGTTGEPPTGDTGGESTTGSVGSTDSGTTSDVDPTEGSESGDESSSDDVGDTGPDVVCTDEITCGACFSCASEPARACAPATAEWQGESGCMATAQCLLDCSAGGLCLDDCCAGKSAAAVSAAHALDQCRRDECAAADACGSFSNAPCS